MEGALVNGALKKWSLSLSSLSRELAIPATITGDQPEGFINLQKVHEQTNICVMDSQGIQICGHVKKIFHIKITAAEFAP